MNATEKPALPTLVSGGTIRPIVPQDFDQAWRIGNAISKAGMQPPGLETAEKVTIAILAGMEVGLPPMQAIQSIAIINNRPSIYGDGALALVRASGLLESMDERLDGQEDAQTATCSVKRRGERNPVVRTFSVADAKKAGLWTRKGPWEHYPQRMLAMRARAFALRDGFADVLRGLGVAEEQADIVKAAALQPGPPPDDAIPDFGTSVVEQEHSGSVSLDHPPRSGEGRQQPSPTPLVPPAAADLRPVCVERAFEIAGDRNLDEDEREAELNLFHGVWLEDDKLGHDPDFVRAVFDTAAKVARKELPEQKARLYLSTLMKD
jgi:hypothetical protein